MPLKQTLLIILSIAITGIIFVGYLSASEQLCIAKTGVNTPTIYQDDAAFADIIARMEENAFNSLVAQFDVDTGFFFYLVHPDGSVSRENNDIRQLLASRVLARKAFADEALLSMHEDNLSRIMTDWYREEEGLGYVLVDQKSKLGANALLLRLLVASPLFEEYKVEAARLADGIYHLQNSDGSLNAWFTAPDYEYDEEYLLTFYSGEAILALLEYAEKTGDPKAFAAARASQDFYLQKYVEDIEINYYPAYVPWHTMSLEKLYRTTGEVKYRDAVFVLTDKVLELQDGEVFVGRFYNPETPEYGTPHASSDAVYTEGLAHAYRLAGDTDDVSRLAAYRGALSDAVHNLEQLQYTPGLLDTILYSTHVRKRVGGVTTNACSNWIRIDSTAHLLDALDATAASFH